MILQRYSGIMLKNMILHIWIENSKSLNDFWQNRRFFLPILWISKDYGQFHPLLCSICLISVNKFKLIPFFCQVDSQQVLKIHCLPYVATKSFPEGDSNFKIRVLSLHMWEHLLFLKDIQTSVKCLLRHS